MDPLWAFVADVWWVAPMTVGAGAVGWMGMRGQRTAGARRLELRAAQNDLRSAREALTRARAEVAAAHAELVRTQAERSAHRAADRDVASSRRALQDARHSVKAAVATLQSRRLSLQAARATVPRTGADPSEYPLAKVMGTHNSVLVRWMQYETDPALLIAFPAMSDGRSRVMAAFLRDQSEAQALRPPSATTRMTPEEFGAYRDAVRRAEKSFDAAEHEVLHGAARPATPFGSGNWSDTAQDLLASAQRAVAWSAEAMARFTRL